MKPSIRSIIEDHRKSSRWALSNGNNSILWIPRSTVYDIMAKYMALEQSMKVPARKSASRGLPQSLKELISVVQALISDNLGQSLRVLLDIVKPWMETVASRRPYIFQHDTPTRVIWFKIDFRTTSICFDSRNSGLSIVQIKSLGLLRMERSWKGHKQVSASQCDLIRDCYWGSIRWHGQCYITACVRTLQTENRSYHSN